MMSRSARWSSGARPASGGGRLLEALGEPLADLGAALGDDEHLHAPVVRRAAALDQAAVLEAVDDPGDVRVVAVQRLGEVAHRHRPVGVEHAERAHLRRRELELGRDRRGSAGARRGTARASAPRPRWPGWAGGASRSSGASHGRWYLHG